MENFLFGVNDIEIKDLYFLWVFRVFSIGFKLIWGLIIRVVNKGFGVEGI